jgi:hypothetical protein
MSPGDGSPGADRAAARAESKARAEKEKTDRVARTLGHDNAEALRKWKEGDSNSSKSDDYLALPYRRQSLGSSTLLEQWQLKAGISLAITVMLLIPYFSYWIWFVLLPPLRVIVPSSPSLQLDVFSGNFHEPTIWGIWYLEGGAILPLIPGFLLFFTYFYFLANMFIPEYKMKQHVFITILWVWFFISWAIGIPPSPFEWFFTDI